LKCDEGCRNHGDLGDNDGNPFHGNLTTNRAAWYPEPMGWLKGDWHDWREVAVFLGVLIGASLTFQWDHPFGFTIFVAIGVLFLVGQYLDKHLSRVAAIEKRLNDADERRARFSLLEEVEAELEGRQLAEKFAALAEEPPEVAAVEGPRLAAKLAAHVDGALAARARRQQGDKLTE